MAASIAKPTPVDLTHTEMDHDGTAQYSGATANTSPTESTHHDNSENNKSLPGKEMITTAQNHDEIEMGVKSTEPVSEQPIERVATSVEEFSVLTVGQKKLMIMTASMASLFSPMATAIYCKYYFPSWKFMDYL